MTLSIEISLSFCSEGSCNSLFPSTLVIPVSLLLTVIIASDDDLDKRIDLLGELVLLSDGKVDEDGDKRPSSFVGTIIN